MGRRKLETKRIEDKSSRQVAFSKRRAGLIKKAHHLSVLCDVEVAVVIISSGGKLYEYCSSATVWSISFRGIRKAAFRQKRKPPKIWQGINNTCTKFRTCNDLLQAVRRVDEDVSVSDMTELEEELNAAIMHTRSRKKELMMERISSFHQQEKKLDEEKEELRQQVASAAAAKKKQKDDGAGVEDEELEHQTSSQLPQQLVTL